MLDAVEVEGLDVVEEVLTNDVAVDGAAVAGGAEAKVAETVALEDTDVEVDAVALPETMAQPVNTSGTSRTSKSQRARLS